MVTSMSKRVPVFRTRKDIGCDSCREGDHENCVTILNPGHYPIDSEDSYEPPTYCRCYTMNPEQHWDEGDIDDWAPNPFALPNYQGEMFDGD